jgi:hypothetical protein
MITKFFHLYHDRVVIVSGIVGANIGTYGFCSDGVTLSRFSMGVILGGSIGAFTGLVAPIAFPLALLASPGVVVATIRSSQIESQQKEETRVV